MADHEIYEDRIALEHVRRQLSTDSEEFPDEILDPRIQTELEKLNKASEEINKLELELDDARSSFRQALSESTQKLNALAKKLGSCVDKARPYYDARVKAKEIHMETQKVALRYERACSMHEAAKEMVQLAEQGYVQREQMSDPAWQEMLNHATMKVNEAEKERNESESEHQKITQQFKQAEERVQFLQRDLKRAIAKSKPYFEMKIKFNQVMEDQKFKVGTLEEDVSSAKALYSQALHSLEAISDEIHRKRLERRKHLQLGIRSAGVGAEDPAPPPSWDGSSSHIDGRLAPHRYLCSDSRVAEQSTVTSKDKSIHNQQSKSDVDTSATEIFADSLLFSSPDRARSHSYRTAIETSQTSLPVVSPVDSLADYDENFDVSSLEDDYMNLPKTHSPRGRVDPHAGTSNTVRGAARIDRSISLTVQDRTYHDQVATRRSRANSQPIAIKGHLSHGDLTSEMQSATESESSSSSLHRSPKLQGLILRVDATLDPLQKSQGSKPIMHQYSKNPPTVSAKTETNVLSQAAASKPTSNVSSSMGKIVAVSSAPVSTDPLNVSAVLGPTSQGSPAKLSKVTKPQSVTSGASIKDSNASSLSSPAHELKNLRTPSSTEMSQLSVDDSSDTESIASMGPMFDDDQIEFLTMDFSKQTSKDDLSEDMHHITRHSWSRMSLPPRLGYLEGYLNKRTSDSSVEKQIDEKSEFMENVSEPVSETVSGHNKDRLDAVALEPGPEGCVKSADLEPAACLNRKRSDSQSLELAAGDSNFDKEKAVFQKCTTDSLNLDSVGVEPVCNSVEEEDTVCDAVDPVVVNHLPDGDTVVKPVTESIHVVQTAAEDAEPPLHSIE
ncbi:uncharacterized protein LOC121385409 isoform X2 [Gigantopelta aegis]|uniref:uncharacterized protein LOC121385409 isoform X2 n=1 Tax=Gigantopelta aegis TaxID=1735272 RepID=UPI001B88AC36|nr:uncharacterized protein LOC121385409 isoform X2 [Gigantopelta aegis]